MLAYETIFISMDFYIMQQDPYILWHVFIFNAHDSFTWLGIFSDISFLNGSPPLSDTNINDFFEV